MCAVMPRSARSPCAVRHLEQRALKKIESSSVPVKSPMRSSVGTGLKQRGAVMEGNVVSVERVIAAPAAELFGIVADASRHPEIDGSGAVVKLKEGAPRHLTLGATFGMSMKLGVPYVMSNTVI